MLLNHRIRRAYSPGQGSLINSEYPDSLKPIVSMQGFENARNVITQWPGYSVTPLRSLPHMANMIQLGHISYKDEGTRFDIGSFKGLGGPYAVYRLIESIIKEKTGQSDITVADIFGGRYRDIIQNITVTCATDGNHGRSVAWGAQLFGANCVIYIHSLVSEGRKQAIEHYGAECIRVNGNYDDAVKFAQEEATRHGRFVISDTSYPGYMEVAKDVMTGYTVMVDEALNQIEQQELPLPTHVFVQGGVGALAAGVFAYLWEKFGAKRPAFIMVEPDKADCLITSAEKGIPTKVHGKLDTIQAGLACGEVSLLAWDILKPCTDLYITITDDSVRDTMRLLANGSNSGDTPIVAGESAVAGLAGAILCAQNPELRAQIGLDEHSHILIFGTESDTDPQLYTEIVGKSADEVRKAA